MIEDLIKIIEAGTAGLFLFNLLYIGNKAFEGSYLLSHHVRGPNGESYYNSRLAVALTQSLDKLKEGDYKGFIRAELTTFPTFSSWYEGLRNISSKN